MWSIGNLFTAHIQIVNGKYIIEHKREKGEYTTLNSINLTNDMDFIIEALIEKIEGNDSNCYGLFWGTYDNGYIFKISENGYYSIEKMEKRKTVDIIPRKMNNINKNWKSKNKLTIVKQGNITNFHVNDEYLNGVANLIFDGNKMGFSVEGETKIAVDYIHIYKIRPEETPPSDKTDYTERWKDVGKTRYGAPLYIDSQTISYLSTDIVRLWIKANHNEKKFLDLLEIDCSQNKFRILDERLDKNPELSPHSQEWEFIPPESTPELIHDTVCTKRK